MGVNVIVATIPSNSEVTSLRWMSLNKMTIVRTMRTNVFTMRTIMAVVMTIVRTTMRTIVAVVM